MALEQLFKKAKSATFREVSVVFIEERSSEKAHKLEGLETDSMDASAKILDFQVGTPGSVEFDFLKVLDHMRAFNFNPKQSSSAPFFYSFLHNHPPGFGTGMSSQDESCARGLLKGYGLDELRFYIICFDNDNPTNISGKISLYRWALDESGNLKKMHLDEKHIDVDISSKKFTSAFLTSFRFIKMLSYKGGYLFD